MEAYPYTNTQNLNLDWILEVVADFKSKYTDFGQAVTDSLQAIEDAKDESLESLANALAASTTTINNAKMAAIQEMNEEKASILDVMGQTLQTAITAIETAQETAVADVGAEKDLGISALQNQQSLSIAAINTAYNQGITRLENLINTFPLDDAQIIGQLQIINSILNGTDALAMEWQQGLYVYDQADQSYEWSNSQYSVSNLRQAGCSGRKLHIQTNNPAHQIAYIYYWTSNNLNSLVSNYIGATETTYTFPNEALFFSVVLDSSVSAQTPVNVADVTATAEWIIAGFIERPEFEDFKDETYDKIDELKSPSANLFYVTDRTNRTIQGVDFTFNDDGSFTAVGTASGTINIYIMGDTNSATTRLNANTTYTCTRWIVSGTGNVRLRNATNSTNIITGTNNYMSTTITPNADTRVSLQIGNNVAVNGTFRFQIEEGSVATEYSPALPAYANDAVARMRVEDLNRVYTTQQMINIEYRSGLDSSLYQGAAEGLFISVGSVKYVLVHSIDASKNCNCWRIWRAVSKNELKSLTTNGEWECAIRMNGWNDFSGGYIHGNEIMNGLTVYVDGAETSLVNLSSGVNGYSVRIVESSIIYSNISTSTAVANHGKEYLFTSKGLTISQSLNWLINGTLGKCYLAMLPCAKAYAKKYYTDTEYKITNLPSTNDYSVDYPDARNVQIFGANAAYSFGITKYPEGLTNGDALLITDNYISTPTSYHKYYYRVCDGGSIESGTIWKSKTEYDLEYIE